MGGKCGLIQKIKRSLRSSKIMQERVRAVIIEDNKVLLMHRVKTDQEYWVFPGGGVEEYDSSHQSALIRECKEELGADVEVRELFAEETFDSAGNSIDKQSFYICKIVGGEIGTGTGPEFSRDPQVSGTYKVEWVPLLKIKDVTVYPESVKNKVLKI
jgi:8-oxo-dGTP pyrophosphatase MutT (NUDIX family)